MRNGKIARLPEAVREEIDQRLAARKRTDQILARLNGLPEVQAVLREHFDGRPVNKQSLSQWRLGGHQDWQQRRELRRTVLDLAGQARELEQAADPNSLHDGLETLYGVALVAAAQKMFAGAKSVRVQMQLASMMSRGLVTVRSMVQRAELARLQEQGRTQKQRIEAERRELAGRLRHERRLLAGRMRRERQALAEKLAQAAPAEPEPAGPAPVQETP